MLTPVKQPLMASASRVRRMTADAVPRFLPARWACVKKCLHIPPCFKGRNYAVGVGRCRAHFVRTSLLVQGSEDVMFGYQAFTKFWCSQLFLPDGRVIAMQSACP